MPSHPNPPPLPNAKSARRTYLGAAALLFPSVFIWLFAGAFLMPRMEQIWKDAGLSGSSAQWLVDSFNAIKGSGRLLLAALVLIMMALELRWPAWPRYRRPVVFCMTLLVQTAVLVGLAWISTAVLLAAPLLGKTKKPPAPATAQAASAPQDLMPGKDLEPHNAGDNQ